MINSYTLASLRSRLAFICHVDVLKTILLTTYSAFCTLANFLEVYTSKSGLVCTAATMDVHAAGRGYSPWGSRGNSRPLTRPGFTLRPAFCPTLDLVFRGLCLFLCDQVDYCAGDFNVQRRLALLLGLKGSHRNAYQRAFCSSPRRRGTAQAAS